MLNNLHVMGAAFDRIGEAAGRSNPSAMAALKQCAGSGTHVSGFAANALGTAAAGGNTEALEMLLQYDLFGILESSAVGALRPAAAKGDPQAIAFLAQVLDDPNARALWSMAAQGLRGPAATGNAAAAEAIKRYNLKLQKQR